MSNISAMSRIWVWLYVVFSFLVLTPGQLAQWTPMDPERRDQLNVLTYAWRARFLGCARDLSNKTLEWLYDYIKPDHMVNATYVRHTAVNYEWCWDNVRDNFHHKYSEPQNWALGEEERHIPIIGWRGGHANQLLAFVVGSLLVDFLGLPFVYIRDATNMPDDIFSFTQQLCSSRNSSALIDVEIASNYYEQAVLDDFFTDLPNCFYDLGSLGTRVWAGLYVHSAQKGQEVVCDQTLDSACKQVCEDSSTFVDEHNENCSFWSSTERDCHEADVYYGYSPRGEQDILNNCRYACQQCRKVSSGFVWHKWLQDNSFVGRLTAHPEQLGDSPSTVCTFWNYFHSEWGLQYSPDYGCIYVPPHCCPEGIDGGEEAIRTCLETGTCVKIFHPRPGYFKGHLEAMITTYQLPYYVQYIGHYQMGLLETHYSNQNFLMFVPSPDPFFNLNVLQEQAYAFDLETKKIRRVQFPTDMRECDETFYPANPSTDHHCDITGVPTHKWVSKWFRDQFPAGVLALQRLDVNMFALQELLGYDNWRPVPSQWQLEFKWQSVYDSGVCTWVRRYSEAIQEGVIGNCARADQPTLDEKCTCHEGLIPASSDPEPLCLPCPQDSYCMMTPQNGAQAVKGCGLPNSTTGSGRRRRGMGPKEAEDCQCMPGYGWPSTGVHQGDSATCLPCSPGLYKENHRADYCSDPCGGNSWSAVGSSSHLDCVCPPGMFRENTYPTNCVICSNLRGAECPGGALPPKALPGYIVVLKNETNGTDYRLIPEFFKCWNDPIAGPCKGDNKCMTGTTGWLCSKCETGWAKANIGQNCEKCHRVWAWAMSLAVNLALTMISVFYATIMAENAVDHSTVHSVILKIVVHHLFVTKLAKNMDYHYTMGAYRVSGLFHDVHLALACKFESLGIVEPMWFCVSLIFYIPCYVLLSLAWCYIIYCVITTFKHAHIAVCQRKAKNASDLLQVVDVMIELHVIDKEAGRTRMFNIRKELEAFIDDLVYQSRVMYIWRTIRYKKELEKHSAFPMTKLFCKDCSTLVLIWAIWLFMLIGPKIFISLWYWRPYREVDEAVKHAQVYAFMSTDLKFWSLKHTCLWIVLALVFVAAFIVLPIFAFLQLLRGLRTQTLTKQRFSQQWGFIYHGLQLTYPQVFYEAFHIVIRFCVGLLSEGILPDTIWTLTCYRMLAVIEMVAHMSILPYEKVGGSKLNLFKGLSNVVWLVTAQILLVEPDLYLGTDSHKHEALIRFVAGINWVFHIAVLYGIFSELCCAVYLAVEVGRSPEEKVRFPGDMFEEIRTHSWSHSYKFLGNTLRLFYSFHKRLRQRSLIFTVICRSKERQDGNHGNYVVSTNELVLSEPERLAGTWASKKHLLKDTINNRLMSLFGYHVDSREDSYLQRAPTQTTISSATTSSTTQIDELPVEYTPDVHEGVSGRDDIENSRLKAKSKSNITMLPQTALDGDGDSQSPISKDYKAQPKAFRAHARPYIRAYNNADRSSLARLLMEALDVMVTNHGLMSVPYCFLEYLIADCCFMLCQTRSEEIYKRQQVFEFIMSHLMGPEEGITEVFIANKDTPTLTTGKRSDRLKALRFGAHLFNTSSIGVEGRGHNPRLAESAAVAAGAEYALSSDKSIKFMYLIRHGLTTQDLERYVTNLKCQEPAYTSVGIQGFAEEVAQIKREVCHACGKVFDFKDKKACRGCGTLRSDQAAKVSRPSRATQTDLPDDKEVQVDALKSTGVNTDESLLHKSRMNEEKAAEELDEVATNKSAMVGEDEKRIAGDGKSYTKAEFQKRYRDSWQTKWDSALPDEEWQTQSDAMIAERDSWKIDSILRGRIDAWIVDNSRLRATSSGLGYRKSPNLHAKDGMSCAPWGSMVQANVLNDEWLEVMTENGLRFLPRSINGKTAVRPYTAKETYDAILEEAEVSRREAEVLEEETLMALKSASEDHLE